MTRPVLAAAGAAMLTVAFLLTAPAATAEPTRCVRAAGYITDPDPNGVNVRAAPSIRGRKIAVIPKRRRGTVVDVTASENGWLLVTRAEDAEGRMTFRGRGWIHASRLGVSLRQRHRNGTPLYAGPSTRLRIVRWFPGPGDNYQAAFVTCRGAWVLVRLKGATGWLAPNNRCPLPWTTCP